MGQLSSSDNNEDSWKDLVNANKGRNMKAGETVQRMITRMNQIRPFSEAKGILDNGCGPGSIISHIIDIHGSHIPASTTVLASDLSQGMLDALNETRQSKSTTSGNLWNRLEVRRLDAHDLLGVLDESISHVTGGHLYFLLSDPRKGLLATHRVLDNGGIIALTSGKYSQHIDALCDAFEHIRPRGIKLELLREPWKSEAGVQGELEATGFAQIETFTVETEMAYEGHEAFARMLMLMPVMRDATVDFTDDENGRLLQQIVVNLRKANPKEPGSLRGASIVALAQKPG